MTYKKMQAEYKKRGCKIFYNPRAKCYFVTPSTGMTITSAGAGVAKVGYYKIFSKADAQRVEHHATQVKKCANEQLLSKKG